MSVTNEISVMLNDSLNSTFLAEGGYSNGSMTNRTDGGGGGGGEPPEFTVTFRVIMYILYNSVFVATLIGNTMVVYVVFNINGMRTVTNYLIANLAIGDLFLAVLCIPFGYIALFFQYWPFGLVLCHLIAPAQAVVVFVSAYTLVVISVDRYMAILFPLKPRLRRSQATWIICIVWIVAILQAGPLAYFTVYKEIDEEILKPVCSEDWSGLHDHWRVSYDVGLLFLQFIFPVGVLIITYVRIAFAIWGKRAPGEAEVDRDQRLAKAKRKMVKMMVTVVIVYTISWLPFNILMVLRGMYGGVLDHYKSIEYITVCLHFLSTAHSAWNPFIYCWMNSRFRKGFRTSAARIPCCRRFFLPRQADILQGMEYRLKRLGTRSTQHSVAYGNGHGRLMRATSFNSNNQTMFTKEAANNSIHDCSDDHEDGEFKTENGTEAMWVRQGTKFGI